MYSTVEADRKNNYHNYNEIQNLDQLNHIGTNLASVGLAVDKVKVKGHFFRFLTVGKEASVAMPH